MLSQNRKTFVFRIDIIDKWNRLEMLAQERDECLKENRKKWKIFRRQLEDLEQASQFVTNIDHSRENSI